MTEKGQPSDFLFHPFGILTSAFEREVLMRLGFHGGMCCGIKHIFEMGRDPNEMCDPIKAQLSRRSEDVTYTYCSSEESFFWNAAPKETKEQRLDTYLNFLKEYRPCGIVEITLITNGCFSQEKWLPILEKRGFKEVTPEGGVYNSNSGNKVRVFNLYMER